MYVCGFFFFKKNQNAREGNSSLRKAINYYSEIIKY